MKITGQQLADAAVEKRPIAEEEYPYLLKPQITYQQEMCDAFVRNSFKRAGGDMGRYAGSNDMFRNALSVMYPLDMAKKQGIHVPGALLFIVEPGHNDKYNDDLGDASHVGIYTGAPEAEVMHSSASRGGVFPSTLKNAWTHMGLPKAATFGEEYGGRGGDIVSDQKTLFRVVLPEANKGQTVNMRKNPEPNSVVYEKIPDGTQLLAGDEFTRGGQRWRQVRYNSMTGYIMAQYLVEVNSTDEAPYFPVAPNTNETPRTLEARVKHLEEWLAIILKETGIDKRFGGM